MKFSIIVPFYNVEQYIERCIASLVAQDFPKEEYEIIAVNDCSPDNTEQILKQKFTDTINLRIVQNPRNMGQGGARNTGIRLAKGDYLFFVDSDDCWLFSDVLATFNQLTAETEANVIRSLKWETIDSDADYFVAKTTKKHHWYAQSPSKYLNSTIFFYNVWSTCYKKDFLIGNNIFFRENIFFEDSDWTIKMLWHLDEVLLFDYKFYGYRTNLQSTTSKPRLKTFEDNAASVGVIYSYLQEIKPNSEFKEGVFRQIRKSILSYIRISRNYTIKDSIRIIKSVPYRLIRDIPLNIKTNIIDRSRLFLLYRLPFVLVAPIRMATIVKRKLKSFFY